MMKVKLGQLVNSQTALQTLREQRIPARVGFALKRIIPSVANEIQHFEQQRIELCEKLGTKNTDHYDLGENVATFNQEFRDLLNSEIEFPFAQLKPDDIAISNMTELELEQLDWLFESDAPATP